MPGTIHSRHTGSWRRAARQVSSSFPWNRELKDWFGKHGDVVPLLKAAVLFHDIGKPGAYTVDAEGDPHFYGHAARGADRCRHDEKAASEPTGGRADKEMGPVSHGPGPHDEGHGNRPSDRKGKDPLLEKAWERCPGHVPPFTLRFSCHRRAFRHGRPTGDLLPGCWIPF